MLIIPMGTDAPIYHWPKATVALIVLNVACFIAVPPYRYIDPETEEIQVTNFDRYALTLGDGLHPVQWVTHNFLHGGVVHLLGNMVFLWAFGIVVEGKLGMVKYLLVYLLIGTLHGALTQTILLRSGLHTSAVGASAIIFGLLAICMVWAPYNEVNCTFIMWIGIRVFVNQFDLRYTWVAALYIGEQILNLVFWGGLFKMAVISELGHLSGAFWGVAVGLGMLKLGLVDCEGWDVITLWKKNRKLAKDWKLREQRLDRAKESDRAPRKRREVSSNGDQAEPSDEERASNALKKVRKLIDMGDYDAAVAAYDRSARTLPAWPPASDLMELIKSMHARQAEAASLPLMRDYCRKFPTSANKMRLKIAQVLIRDKQKPVAALRVLGEIPESALGGSLELARVQLVRQAEKMINDGVLELEGEE